MVRSKHRYITLKIITTKKSRNISDIVIKNGDLFQAISSKVKKMHGDYGVASVKTGLVCKYCNEMTGVAILKMRRFSHRFVSTVIPFILNIGTENMQLQTLRTSGTLQQAYKHLKYYQEKEFEKIWYSLDENLRFSFQRKYNNLNEIHKLLASQKEIHARK